MGKMLLAREHRYRLQMVVHSWVTNFSDKEYLRYLRKYVNLVQALYLAENSPYAPERLELISMLSEYVFHTFILIEFARYCFITDLF